MKFDVYFIFGVSFRRLLLYMLVNFLNSVKKCFDFDKLLMIEFYIILSSSNSSSNIFFIFLIISI